MRLLVELGLYGTDAPLPPEDRALRDGVEFRQAEAGMVDAGRREVCLTDDTTVPYDVPVVATGRGRDSLTDRSAEPRGEECVQRSPGPPRCAARPATSRPSCWWRASAASLTDPDPDPHPGPDPQGRTAPASCAGQPLPGRPRTADIEEEQMTTEAPP